MCLSQAAAIVRCYISWVRIPYFSAQPAIVLPIDNGLSIGSLFHARSHLNQSAETTISSKMFPQGRKHFRFRFIVVLAFALLLTSPTHQSEVPFLIQPFLSSVDVCFLQSAAIVRCYISWVRTRKFRLSGYNFFSTIIYSSKECKISFERAH